MVKLLLEAGANVHAENYGALRWASYRGHAEVVKILEEYMKTHKITITELRKILGYPVKIKE